MIIIETENSKYKVSKDSNGFLVTKVKSKNPYSTYFYEGESFICKKVVLRGVGFCAEFDNVTTSPIVDIYGYTLTDKRT